MKRLIVTADDFGLTYGVNSGIVEAFQRGIVTSTSLMVNAPAAEQAGAQARNHDGLSVGLHLVLTLGHPVGPPDSLSRYLDDKGAFPRDPNAYRRAEASEVAPEIDAQLVRFQRSVGRPPAHIDGHHHVHQSRGVMEATLKAAARLGIAVRSPTDASREQIRQAEGRTPDHFIADFYGKENVSEARLFEILESVPHGTSELMCHPAHPDPLLRRISSYADERSQELITLLSPRLPAKLKELGIELVPSSQART